MSTPKKKSVSQSPRSSVKKNCPPPRTRQPASPRAIVTTSAQRQQPALDAATREEAERVGERERIKRIHRLGDRPIEDEGLEDVRVLNGFVLGRLASEEDHLGDWRLVRFAFFDGGAHFEGSSDGPFLG